jgi:hypothetical protein
VICFENIRSLSWQQWRIILLSLIFLPLCTLSLRAKGFASTRKRLLSKTNKSTVTNAESELAQAREITRAVDIAVNRVPFVANCLARSLVLCRFLQLAGVSCDLRFGADLSEVGFSAHAWVEHKGVALNDSQGVGSRFVPFGSSSD